jgi:hypothetical protein
MTRDVAKMLGRIDRYLDRVKRGIRNEDKMSVLADIAELGEICRRLYNRLQVELYPKKEKNDYS